MGMFFQSAHVCRQTLISAEGMQKASLAKTLCEGQTQKFCCLKRGKNDLNISIVMSELL